MEPTSATATPAAESAAPSRSGIAPTKTLEVERQGRVLVVRIQHPPFNWLSRELIDQLDDLTRVLSGDRSIGAVVLTGGAPDRFVTHADVPALAGAGRVVGRSIPRPAASLGLRAAWLINRIPPLRRALDQTPARDFLALRRAGDLFRRINRLDQVFIAAINGTALGGGFEVATACDIRLAADGPIKLGFIESWLGLTTGTGAAQRLGRSVGSARALELLISGRIMSPDEAKELGLINDVVPADRLIEEATSLAERLSRRQPETTGATKRALYDGISRPLGRAITLEQSALASVLGTRGTIAACESYAAELEAIDPEEPLPTERILPKWDHGTAVDLVNPDRNPGPGPPTESQSSSTKASTDSDA